MYPLGRILIVDDDAAFRETYEELVAGEGYEVGLAKNADEARALLDSDKWDVVILDQRLHGPGGGDSGLDLLEQGVARGARVIIATAYADADAIRRAFEAGAYDYLEKTQLLRTLLSVKLRNATDFLHGGSRSSEAVESELQKAWAAAKSAEDRTKKGRLLEVAMRLLFSQVQGFGRVTTNLRTKDEEIDLVITNESSDQVWSREGAYILGECKNWSTPVGRRELDVFVAKLKRRRGRATLGFFIAMAGVTGDFRTALPAERQDDIAVIVLERGDVEALITASDRNAYLKELHQRAVMVGEG
ncbi:MAG: response regulator [Deltaproteobacteria bacterium]